MRERFFYTDDLKIQNLSALSCNGEIIRINSITKSTNLPRVTVCGLISDDGVVSFGVSKCSPEDRFIKKVGRDLAKQRAHTNPYCILHYSENMGSFSEFFNEACMDIACEALFNAVSFK